MHRASDPACVVIPPEVFGISEKPLYEFHGHKADVLDLAWSNNEVSTHLNICIIILKLVEVFF